MARIRSVKPEFWKSEAIACLPIRTRLTFIGLWSYVDDNGVGRDNARLITAELYPLEEDPRETLAEVQRDIAELQRSGRIDRYTVDGVAYLAITNWTEHQRIDKPNKPRYPLPEKADPAPTCGYGDPRDTLATSSREGSETPAPGAVELGIREQGTGDQGVGTAVVVADSPKNPRGTRLPKEFQLPDEWRTWAHEAGYDPVAVALFAEKFADYWHSVAGSKGVKVDWFATWRNWVRNERKPVLQQPKESVTDQRIRAGGDVTRHFAAIEGVAL